MQLPATDLPVHRWSVPGTARADGTPVALPVAAIGSATAPAVVVAHGVGSSARFVAAACAAPLTRAGYRLVVLDQRGHGDATPCPAPGDHALDAYADDLAAVVTTVTGPIAAVGGISLGGHAAVRAALPHPCLVALPGWSGRRTAGEGPHAALAAEVATTGVAALTERLRTDPGLPGWLRDTLVTDYTRHDPASLAAALVALDGADGPTTEEVLALAPPAGPGMTLVAWPDDPGHPLTVAEDWAARTGGPLQRLLLRDPDERLTRFGDALVAALVALPAAWPPWADAPIEIVDPDPTWPAQATALIADLRRHPVLRDVPIEHIGSTAVPALAAKPVLDLMADLPVPATDRVAAALVADGWALIPPDPGDPDRGRLVLAEGAHRRAHLHLLAGDGTRWDDHLRFREALRADVALAGRYATHKRDLARRYGHDREAYTEAKAAFIAAVLSAGATGASQADGTSAGGGPLGQGGGQHPGG